MKKKKRKLDNIRCDVCGYCNHKEYVKYSGVCHLCGKILDDRAYFKCQMNKRLRLWRGKKTKRWDI
jgi:hypothetical protein